MTDSFLLFLQKRHFSSIFVNVCFNILLFSAIILLSWHLHPHQAFFHLLTGSTLILLYSILFFLRHKISPSWVYIAYQFIFSHFIIYTCLTSNGTSSPFIMLVLWFYTKNLYKTESHVPNIHFYHATIALIYTVSFIAFCDYFFYIPPIHIPFASEWVGFLLIVSVIKYYFFIFKPLQEIQIKYHHLQENNHHLEEAYARLHQEQKEKNLFMAHMSHEFRTPLNAIIGFSEVMMLEIMGKIPEGYKEYCMNIHYSGKHLLGLVNNILDMAQIQNGKYVPRIHIIALENLILQVVAWTKDLAHRKNIDFNIITHFDGIPSFHSDEQAIKQILINLISNAIKYGDSNCEIVIHAHYDNHLLTFLIENDGKGFTEKTLAHLGDNFNQGLPKNNNSYEQSTGLGIAITKGLIEILGGTLQARNDPDRQKAIVTVTLPNRDLFLDQHSNHQETPPINCMPLAFGTPRFSNDSRLQDKDSFWHDC